MPSRKQIEMLSDSSNYDDDAWFKVVKKEICGKKNANAEVVTKTYAMSSVVLIKYLPCGNGFFVAPFIENQTDGIIKLNPGATKKRSRSKNSSLRFYVLQGKVDILCDDNVLKLETFCYMEVLNDAYYSMKNSGDVTTYVIFNRFDRKPKEVQKK